MKDVLKGELVQLGAVDMDELSKVIVRWERDSEFMRLLDAEAVRLFSRKSMQKLLEKDMDEENVSRYWFTICSLADNQLLGDITLHVNSWLGRDAFIGIGIGEREFWGKGYGTDAMKLILQYAFTEINLERVSLTVFEYNPRAIRSYEKAGFSREGRMRKFLNKDGKRWDMFMMGILREEWMEQNGSQNKN